MNVRDEPLSSFVRCRVDRFSLRVEVLHPCYFFVVFRNDEFCSQDRVNFDSVLFHLQYTLDSWLKGVAQSFINVVISTYSKFVITLLLMRLLNDDFRSDYRTLSVSFFTILHSFTTFQKTL